MRHVFLTVGLVIACVDLACLFKVTVSNTPEKVLKSSNPFQKALDWASYELQTTTSIGVTVAWGLEPQLALDPSLGRWEAPTDGLPRLNSNFRP
jgi:hypothetical protein